MSDSTLQQNQVNSAGPVKAVMTVQQAAEKWGLSIRWVSKLCKEGRIEGAQKVSPRYWLMPQDTPCPTGEIHKRSGRKPWKNVSAENDLGKAKREAEDE